MNIENEALEKLIQCVDLKYIVRTYKLTIEQIKKYVVPHPMKYDNDDVSPYFLLLYQSHLDKKTIYDSF